MEAEVEFFAGDDNDDDFDFAVPEGDSEWRVEKRYYTKKDGQNMVYWNYRARVGFVDANGKRIVPYKKGGKQNA